MTRLYSAKNRKHLPGGAALVDADDQPVWFHNDKPDHKQVLVFHSQRGIAFPIDHRIHKIIGTLWAMRIETQASCQGKRGCCHSQADLAYILFFDVRDADKIATMLRQRKIPFRYEAEYPEGNAVIRFHPNAIPAVRNMLGCG